MVAYRLKLDEQLERSIRRIAKEQLAAGEKILVDCPDAVLAVHSARKSIKRLRALIRLVRPGMGKADYKRLDVRFRDIGRSMSSRRDEDVLRATLGKLHSDGILGDRVPKSAIEGLERVLDEWRRQPGRSIDVEKVVKTLGQARRQFTRASLDLSSFDVIAEGVSKVYGRGQRAFGIAMVSPSVEHIHELRKDVQRHWRHMQILSPLWPEFFKARVLLAQDISALLGSDHDLAGAMEFIEANGEAMGSEKSQRALIEGASERQFDLRQKAFSRCEVLLASDVGEWHRVLPKYWRSARRMSDETVETVC